MNIKQDKRTAYSRVSRLCDSRKAFLFSSYVKKGNLINFHRVLEDLETRQDFGNGRIYFSMTIRIKVKLQKAGKISSQPTSSFLSFLFRDLLNIGALSFLAFREFYKNREKIKSLIQYNFPEPAATLLKAENFEVCGAIPDSFLYQSSFSFPAILQHCYRHLESCQFQAIHG